ncbi:trypsin-like serine peptidase [Sinosporangium siamense]|uniref:Trypsin-like serine protease n=1 Tax=Sinosporangium siamense TaxID=1367973 RepID=A0A919V5J4_9ACTN|nr:hypothetical protein [Sinosporangium siamense]GII89987.1 hypothetical protein Ssi02_02180 [Sinosporangium siamense]
MFTGVTAIAMTTAVASAAQPAADPFAVGGAVAWRHSQESPAEVARYWQPERVRRARPALPTDLPFRLNLRALTIPATKVLTPGGDSYGYAPVARPYIRRGPERVTGLLVGHDPATGQDLTCGAAVVRSESKSLVATAAHCVFANRGGGRRRLTHVAFLPAYNSAGDGTAPLGVWPAVRRWVPERWWSRPYSFRSLPYDIALVTVRSSGRGADRLLEDVTGPGLKPRLRPRWTGTAEVDMYGYPADLHYSGADMHRCRAQASDSDTFGMGLLLTRNCQIVGGGSGGPVIAGGTLAGVASSSGPYGDPLGFSLITTTWQRPFRTLLARAERAAAGPGHPR